MIPIQRLPGLIAMTAALAACDSQPSPVWRDGIDLQAVTFTVTDPEMGIHPNDSILLDEGNPFRNVPLDLEAKFLISSEGNNASGFYAWGTVLARQPTGEHQFYAATKLEGLYEGREVDNRSLETVRGMAVGAYQSVLDHFPDSVSYDETGTYAFRLAPLAYKRILDLGAVPEGDWIEVALPDGGTTIVPGGGQ